MRLYEAFRQAKARAPSPEKYGQKWWWVEYPHHDGTSGAWFTTRKEALLYRKRSIAEHAARLMGVTDPAQLDIAWTQDARRPEDLFRLVMKGGE